MMSFLFIWQSLFLAPLSIGSGAVGFAQYAKFLEPGITPFEEKLIAIGVCALITALVYRDTRSVGRLSIAMWTVVLFTAAWITFAGVTHFQLGLVLDFPYDAFRPSMSFFAGLGCATLIA